MVAVGVRMHVIGGSCRHLAGGDLVTRHALPLNLLVQLLRHLDGKQVRPPHRHRRVAPSTAPSPPAPQPSRKSHLGRAARPRTHPKGRARLIDHEPCSRAGGCAIS